jgi:hypothetical protein
MGLEWMKTFVSATKPINKILALAIQDSGLEPQFVLV